MARFADRFRVERALDEQPSRVVALLEGLLTTDQVTTLETALCPTLTTEQKQAALTEAAAQLRRAGETAIADTVAAKAVELAPGEIKTK